MLGLVLEGGANRTYYSVGVLDAFIDNAIKPDLLVGVSAGIANSVSYISGQRGRSLRIGLEFVPDKRYMGTKYFFKKRNRSYFNRDFVFSDMPNKYLPFDYDAYSKYDGEVYAVVTNLKSGKPEYILLKEIDKDCSVIQASCALPFMFPPIKIGNNKYFDGGCSDPLPIKFAYEKGCDKLITILTREESYEKKSETDVKLSALLYHRHKEFYSVMKQRTQIYNDSRKFLSEKQSEGSVFVFSPKSTIGWKRTEKDPGVIQKMYDEGYRDAIRRMDELKKFIEK